MHKSELKLKVKVCNKEPKRILRFGTHARSLTVVHNDWIIELKRICVRILNMNECM